MATPGALALLNAAGAQTMTYIERHASGDWGTIGNYAETQLTDEEERDGIVTSEEAKLNKLAIKQGGRVLSTYDLPGGRLWIITDGLKDGGKTAFCTTLLLPEES
jgi:hypothetical protein